MSFDEDQDVISRTRLANERTYLAWWRSGLTALTVAIGVGKVVPAVTPGERSWPWIALGLLYGAIGLVFIVYAFVRQHAVEAATQRGEFARPDGRLIAAITIFGVLVAGATIAVVAFEL